MGANWGGPGPLPRHCSGLLWCTVCLVTVWNGLQMLEVFKYKLHMCTLQRLWYGSHVLLFLKVAWAVHRGAHAPTRWPVLPSLPCWVAPEQLTRYCGPQFAARARGCRNHPLAAAPGRRGASHYCLRPRIAPFHAGLLVLENASLVLTAPQAARPASCGAFASSSWGCCCTAIS